MKVLYTDSTYQPYRLFFTHYCLAASPASSLSSAPTTATSDGTHRALCTDRAIQIERKARFMLTTANRKANEIKDRQRSQMNHKMYLTTLRATTHAFLLSWEWEQMKGINVMFISFADGFDAILTTLQSRAASILLWTISVGKVTCPALQQE